MASLEATPSGYVISFRYQGRRFNRSLATKSDTRAGRLKGEIEETLDLVRRGRLTPPPDATAAEFWNFIRSGGKLTELPTLTKTITHADAWKEYFNAIPEGAKENSSLKTEKTHSRHFKSFLDANRPFNDIATRKNLVAYVKKRLQDTGRYGRTVSPNTLVKELQTFRQLWGFVKREGYVRGTNPVDEVSIPKSDEKEPFRTYDEIKAIVDRGGLEQNEARELWGCLFLRETEIINEVLPLYQHYAAANPLERYAYPMAAFHCFTSARRSEMLRSRCDDLGGRVRLREKKRCRTKRMTFRYVDMHQRLKEIMDDWLANHPGGQYTFCKDDGSPLTADDAHRTLKRVLRRTKWECIRGFHVLRHSFASNAARRGIHPDIIDRWMGHQTNEMHRRYLHLFPEDMKSAIETMFAD